MCLLGAQTKGSPEGCKWMFQQTKIWGLTREANQSLQRESGEVRVHVPQTEPLCGLSLPTSRTPVLLPFPALLSSFHPTGMTPSWSRKSLKRGAGLRSSHSPVSAPIVFLIRCEQMVFGRVLFHKIPYVSRRVFLSHIRISCVLPHRWYQIA